MNTRVIILIFLLIVNFFPLNVTAKSIQNKLDFKRGVIVSQNKIASQVGAEILRKGGNAIDAAVATGYALGVVEPNGSGIGGGGFALIYLAKTQELTAIDFRERSPQNINKFPLEFRTGPKAGGIPGTVLGFEYLRSNFGVLSRESLLIPAIKLAKNGFLVNDLLAINIQKRKDTLNQYKDSQKIFLPSKEPILKGSIFIQKDLANTLKLIAKGGSQEFYRGKLANSIVKGLKEEGGIIQKSDLANYRVYELKPLCGTYRGNKVCSFPPPSSGGICILETLNILENADLPSLDYASPERLSLLADALKLSFQDRATQLGDQRFHKLPIDKLISKEYAKSLFNSIQTSHLSTKVNSIETNNKEQAETTHWTVADKDGNLAVITASLNGGLGSSFVIPETGILLNNTLDDFSIPQSPNQYGLIGNPLNEPAPNKTPLSSMSPTIVFNKNNEPFLALGSPGGPTIISAVLNVLLAYLDHEFPLEKAVSVGRLHHQWNPDYISSEDSLIDEITREILISEYNQKFPEKGKSIWNQFYWSVEAVELDRANMKLIGVSDPRQEQGLIYE